MRDKHVSARNIILVFMLSMLISIQVFSVSSMAAYYGIQFGSEAQVGTDGTNDVWQLDAWKYYYTANGVSKPEIDLTGLNVTRGVNGEDWYKESRAANITTTNATIDHNLTYSFNLPLISLINVTYTFMTNQTYGNSSIEFFNWTSSTFVNQSIITNVTKTPIVLDFYNKSAQGQEILIHFNITHTVNFTFSYNLSLEFWYSVDQIISVNFASLAPGNAALNDQVKTWIFLDTDADDVVDYAIRWIYGDQAVLYEILPSSFWTDGSWTGELKKYWTGIEWSESTAGLTKDLGNLTVNMLNITFPSFLVNLTASVEYSVWTLKMEADYHYWDALPNDLNWEISTPIPGFQFLFIGLGIALVGLIFIFTIKKPPKMM